MDFNAFFSNPATQQALIALASWGIAQVVKKLGANPNYAPFVAILSGVLTGAATGGGDFPTNAALGLLSGLIASGGHEALKKAAGK